MQRELCTLENSTFYLKLKFIWEIKEFRLLDFLLLLYLVHWINALDLLISDSHIKSILFPVRDVGIEP